MPQFLLQRSMRLGELLTFMYLKLLADSSFGFLLWKTRTAVSRIVGHAPSYTQSRLLPTRSIPAFSMACLQLATIHGNQRWLKEKRTTRQLRRGLERSGLPCLPFSSSAAVESGVPQLHKSALYQQDSQHRLRSSLVQNKGDAAARSRIQSCNCYG
jgi:hypothetical protein